MVRKLLERLFPRESEDLPEHHRERPDVALQRVSSLIAVKYHGMVR